jgi:hypothetical protein
MKINEILTKAPIDQLIDQSAQDQEEPAQATPTQPGQQRDASGRYANQQPGIIRQGIKKISGAIAGASGKSYGSSFIQPDPVKKPEAITPIAEPTATAEPAPTVEPGVVAPENAKYIRAVAQNKVTSQGTGTPEIDAMLRSAGVLKP